MPCNLAMAHITRWAARCAARRAARAGAASMPTVEELDDMYPATGAMAIMGLVEVDV